MKPVGRYIGSTLFFYFSRVFWLWLGVACGVLSAAVLLFGSLELIRRFIGKTTLSLSLLGEMVFLQVPGYLEILLPFLVLLATLITFWKLNHSLEMTIARSAGLSLFQILGGFALNIACLALLNLLIFDPIAAATTRRYELLQATHIRGQSSQLAISETGLWLREVLPTRQTIMRSQSVQLKRRTFSDVTFFNFTPEGDYESRVDAAHAVLGKKTWELSEVTQWDRDNQPKKLDVLAFPTKLTLKKIQESSSPPQSFSFWQLPYFIKMLEKSGISSLLYRIYWHSLIAKIGAMLAMCLIGAVFMIRPPAHRNSKTVLLLGGSVLVGFLFHFSNDISYALGLGGKMPLLLSVWSPSLIAILLSSSILLHFEDG